MAQSLVALFFEVLVLLVLLFTMYKKSNAFFLRPMLALSVIGITVEILSILSDKTILVLPRTTNIYTYTALILLNFWCIIWLVSYFIPRARVLWITCGIYTALWIIAKLSVEPVSRFNALTGKVEYPVSSTTFPLLCIGVLTAIGIAAKIIIRNNSQLRNFTGVFWIFTGLGSYYFLSLTIPAIRPIVIPELQEKIWWLNNVAFGIQSACIAWGLLHISRGSQVEPVTVQAPTKNFILLGCGMVVLFAVKYVLFYDSIGEFIGIALICGFGVLAFNIKDVLIAGHRKHIEEKAKIALQEKIHTSLKQSVESKIDDAATSVAILSTIIDEFAKNASPQARAELEKLKNLTDPHISRLIEIYLDMIDDVIE